VAGVPLLVVDPHEERRQWSYQLHEFLREVDRARDRLLAELAGEEIPQSARRRLQHLHASLADHKDAIAGLFAEAGIEPVARVAADRTRVPGEGAVAAHYDQVLRDWSWGMAEGGELRAALAAIDAVWPPDTPLGRCLVLGAGAGRLPWELVRRFGAQATVALDLNPLPYLVLRRLQGGRDVSLCELPQQARAARDVAVPRVLSAPAPPIELTLAFADGLAPPVAAGAFDTVVTPWFLDQVPPNAADLIREIAGALEVGGRWLNHGPLIYHRDHTRLAHHYRVDEILEMLPAAGFAVDAWSYEPLPYMHSPASSQGRTEFVLTFVARRVEHATETADPQPRADWLEDPTCAVPRWAGLETYQAPHPMFAAVAGLVDGHRSIADIAAVMVARHGLPADAATVGVQGCLREIARALGLDLDRPA
jgi:hypothetical protein